MVLGCFSQNAENAKMHVEFLLVLSLAYWTEQHLLFPVNFCHMATACLHDNRMVCASTPDGCSRRNFLDQCDMYEYNCDYGTRYQETYSKYCETDDIQKYEPSFVPLYVTQKKNPNILRTTEDNSDYLEAEPITTVTNVPSGSNSSTSNSFISTKPTTSILRSTARRTLKSPDVPCHTPPHTRPCEHHFVKCQTCPTCPPSATIPIIHRTWMTSPIVQFTTSKPWTRPCPIHVHPTNPPCFTPRQTTWTRPCPTIQVTPTKPWISTTWTTLLTTLMTTTTERTTTSTTTKPTPTKPSYSITPSPTKRITTQTGRCCNNPSTWLTTTENPITLTFHLDESNEQTETERVIISSTRTTTCPTTKQTTRTTTAPTTWKTTTPTTRKTTTSTIWTTKPCPTIQIISTTPRPTTTIPITTIPTTTIPTITTVESTIWTTTPYPTTQVMSTKPCFSITPSPDIQEVTTKPCAATEKEKCCNRPITWLTTTENPVTVTFRPDEPNTEREYTDADTKRIITSTKRITIFEPPVTTSVIYWTEKVPTAEDVELPTKLTPKKYPDIIVLSDEQRDKDIITITTHKKQKLVLISTKAPDRKRDYNRIVVLKKSEEFEEAQSTLWYPTLCPSNKCQRPLIWTSTKPKQRRRGRY